ncbi:SusC/RagA family TonB-linked outer membrane protein [Chitinophaga lutea]|uniref:SusC/RagA family TonB-linked outer membrane protein n=1 Tax=Chitinophaga lutea TaxID=2488634 RepID=A0A3N4PTN1_9BACT|nr:SusC/RagA family TonB-linked outer membrane protein [Chitinophaga lutea]RPE11992.1 SusC/RagA family TonB-linked outer membrane protein [Chitinophaga lutea]
MKYIYTRLALVGCLLTVWQCLAAQNRVPIKGVVREAGSDERLIGVSILGGNPLKALGVTDNNGAFTVYADPNALMVFRYVGYADYKFKPGVKRELVVRLSTSENKLNEALIVGYQKKTRETVVGSAVKISGKELQDIPVSNVEQLLQGKVAGLNIQNNTGAPGARGFMQLRGISSIGITGGGDDAFLTPTSPLYVIDGVPVSPDVGFEYGFQTAGPGVSPTSMIPPEDIESLEVLKDGQATSLYGSRGAYGVIIITTKRGNSPVPVVRYTGNFFLNTPPKLRPTIGGKEERDFRLSEIFRYGSMQDIYNISYTPLLADSLNPFYNNSTDWQGIFYRKTFNQTHNVGISGGDPKFNYKVNLGYYNESGVIKNTGFTRYSLNTNMEYKPSKKLRVFAAISSSVGLKNKGSGTGLLQKGVATDGKSSSLLPPPSFFLSTNSALSSLNTRNDNKSGSYRINLDVNYELFSGASVSSSLAYSYSTNTEGSYIPSAANKDFSEVYGYNDRGASLFNRNALSFYRKVASDHSFGLSFSNELHAGASQSAVIRQKKTPSDQFQGPLGADGLSSRAGLIGYNRNTGVSFSGNFTYDYKKKYIFDASYRMDASSASGIANRYARNPAAGFRWNFNKENLLKDLSWLSYGSIRMSWGRNIVPNGDIYSATGLYELRKTYNNVPRIGIGFGKLPNPALRPTTTTQYNFGFEAGFFDSHVELSYDAYYKQVDFLTRGKAMPDIVGFDEITSNEVGLVNYGHELSITLRPLPKNSALQWTFSINGALNKDVLTRLPGNERQFLTGGNIYLRVGRNTFSNYLYKNTGVYATDDDVPLDPATGIYLRTPEGVPFRAGDARFLDLDGNYVITDNDRVIMGNSMPLITGGFSTSFRYKNYSLNVNGSYTLIRDVINSALVERMNFLQDPHKPNSITVLPPGVTYWQKPGDNAEFANVYDYKRAPVTKPYRDNQSLFQETGSYYKLNTASFSYTLNKQFVRRAGLNSVRFYGSVNNLFTWSKYRGPSAENVTDLGRDRSDGYPSPHTYNLGLNVDF